MHTVELALLMLKGGVGDSYSSALWGSEGSLCFSFFLCSRFFYLALSYEKLSMFLDRKLYRKEEILEMVPLCFIFILYFFSSFVCVWNCLWNEMNWRALKGIEISILKSKEIFHNSCLLCLFLRKKEYIFLILWIGCGRFLLFVFPLFLFHADHLFFYIQPVCYC